MVLVIAGWIVTFTQANPLSSLSHAVVSLGLELESTEQRPRQAVMCINLSWAALQTETTPLNK